MLSATHAVRRLAIGHSAALRSMGVGAAARSLSSTRTMNNSNTTHDPSKVAGSVLSEQKPAQADSTSREIMASETAAEADAALTKHRADGEPIAAGVVSGAPKELHRRVARVYQPAQESTQSARATSHHWRLDFDIPGSASRWENGLMGWASSADYMQGTHLKFKTKDDAIHFAEKQGYQWFVQEPHHARTPPKAYANNFLYSKDKLRYIRTK